MVDVRPSINNSRQRILLEPFESNLVEVALNLRRRDNNSRTVRCEVVEHRATLQIEGVDIGPAMTEHTDHRPTE